jgi:hypothetical protein
LISKFYKELGKTSCLSENPFLKHYCYSYDKDEVAIHIDREKGSTTASLLAHAEDNLGVMKQGDECV